MAKKPLVVSNVLLPLSKEGGDRSYRQEVSQLLQRAAEWLPRRGSVDHWFAASETMVAEPYLDKPEVLPDSQPGRLDYLLYDYGLRSYAQRDVLLAGFRDPLLQLLDIRAELQAPGGFERLVRRECAPFFRERGASIRRIEAYAAAQRLERQTRISDAEKIYASIVLREHVKEPKK